jgi:hypothetical protein
MPPLLLCEACSLVSFAQCCVRIQEYPLLMLLMLQTGTSVERLWSVWGGNASVS